ncbi:redoxin domain-containing protein [Bacillus mesophilum]|uniref:Redoxin domain-containing protein n=1 Tax=Bacillus mesophilum TaxID=1071718 RepID=A0A7V7RLT9_9BACI|nr:redoxin domain-containing protein [Bacillus mesophilum]KAB2332817.1 redoxin domain-containing protein [Bacillus mesophilum]
MKNTIFVGVILAMLAWAIYDFTNTKNTAKQLNESENEVGLDVGDVAPDFELGLLNKEEIVKLSDFRGQRVMVNFWATWCPPCRAEMPDMEKFHQDRDVAILAVNMTDTEMNDEQVENFADTYELTFPILLDEEAEMADLYNIQPLPTTYMIDSNGIIQYKTLGAMNYELMIQEFEKMD